MNCGHAVCCQGCKEKISDSCTICGVKINFLIHTQSKDIKSHFSRQISSISDLENSSVEEAVKPESPEVFQRRDIEEEKLTDSSAKLSGSYKSRRSSGIAKEVQLPSNHSITQKSAHSVTSNSKKSSQNSARKSSKTVSQAWKKRSHEEEVSLDRESLEMLRSHENEEEKASKSIELEARLPFKSSSQEGSFAKFPKRITPVVHITAPEQSIHNSERSSSHQHPSKHSITDQEEQSQHSSSHNVFQVEEESSQKSSKIAPINFEEGLSDDEASEGDSQMQEYEAPLNSMMKKASMFDGSYENLHQRKEAIHKDIMFTDEDG